MIDWAAMIQAAPRDESAIVPCSREPSGNRTAATGTGDALQPIEPGWNSKKCSRVPTVPAALKEARVKHESDPEPAGGCGADDFRAEVSARATRRPVIDYRLTDPHGAGGSLIGNIGDTFEVLVADLRARYGDRLDWLAVREQFEERAAIMEFDARMSRPAAESAAALDTLARIEAAGPSCLAPLTARSDAESR